jgi:hypothetical protein
MRQIYQQQLFTEPQASINEIESNKNTQPSSLSGVPGAVPIPITEAALSPNEDHGDSERDGSGSDHEDSTSSVAAASMWTRKDIKEFKESVKAEGGEAIIRIGQGESVTVSYRSSITRWHLAYSLYVLLIKT